MSLHGRKDNRWRRALSEEPTEQLKNQTAPSGNKLTALTAAKEDRRPLEIKKEKQTSKRNKKWATALSSQWLIFKIRVVACDIL